MTFFFKTQRQLSRHVVECCTVFLISLAAIEDVPGDEQHYLTKKHPKVVLLHAAYTQKQLVAVSGLIIVMVSIGQKVSGNADNFLVNEQEKG